MNIYSESARCVVVIFARNEVDQLLSNPGREEIFFFVAQSEEFVLLFFVGSGSERLWDTGALLFCYPKSVAASKQFSATINTSPIPFIY